MEEHKSKHAGSEAAQDKLAASQAPDMHNAPEARASLEERVEQRPSFQELIAGVYREDYLKAVSETMLAQARETARYLAYRELCFRAEAVKRDYPDFDLERELENPTFARLLEGGVDPKTAYEVVHHAALRRREERLAENAARPQENGLSTGSATVSKADPRTLTRQERRQLRRRAARGEEIVW